MRALAYTAQFEWDVKHSKKRGKDESKLTEILNRLLEGKTIPAAYLDHPLRSLWKGYREAHIEPDCPLI